MNKCDTCINKKYCANNLDARAMCLQTDYVLFTPTYETNADRIRAMSDEELAHFMARVCPPGGKCNEDGNCFICRRDWLKSPVEVDND